MKASAAAFPLGRREGRQRASLRRNNDLWIFIGLIDMEFASGGGEVAVRHLAGVH